MLNETPQEQSPRPTNPPLRLLHALARGLKDGTITTGDAAALRRLDSAQPDRRHLLPLVRLLAGTQIDDQPDTWQRLALITNCVALARGLHDENRPAGTALHALGVSEQRLMALLAADFATLTDLLPRLARRAGAAAERMDWRPLARLAWTVDRDEAEADRQRRHIASAYLRAAARDNATS